MWCGNKLHKIIILIYVTFNWNWLGLSDAMLDQTSRRDVLKGIGAASIATAGVGLGATAFSDTAEAVSGTDDSEVIVWTTQQSADNNGSSSNPVEGNVAIGIGDALDHVNAYQTGAAAGGDPISLPHGIDTIEKLYDFFKNYLTNNVSDSQISKHSNLLVVREDRFADLFDRPYYAEYEGNVAVSLGAEAVAWEFSEFSPTRAGSDRGHYWLQQCVAAAGVNYGIVDGQGMVYQDSTVGSGQIATPAAPIDDDNNLCGSASNVVTEPDTYDTYFWDGCAGAQARNYFGV